MKKITFLFLLSFYFVSSQNNSEFLKDYSNFSLKLGISQFTGIENSGLPNTLDYNFRNFASPVVGVDYNIFQLNNFNFKTGLHATLIKENQKLFFSQEESGFAFDYVEKLKITTNGMWRISIPISSEYLIPTNYGVLTLNTGFIIGYQEEHGVALFEFDSSTIEGAQLLNLKSIYSRESAPWYFNGQVGVGMYFPFNRWMLRTNIFYNYAFQKLYAGEYQFTNLQQSPDINGTFGFKGNSYGIEFSIYLAKRKKDKN